MTTIDEVRAATLDEAKQRLRISAAQPGGSRCPCCQQHVQIYRRKITTGSAIALVRMFRHDPSGWMHVPTVTGDRSGDPAKLAYWRLVEEETALRADGGRSGYWRITALGLDFVQGHVRVPKYARVYDGRVLTLDPAETVDIRDAIGAKFDYAELMGR